MTHIVLLGDSVIDNKAYVGEGPDVAEQLRKLSPKKWGVTRLALDGADPPGFCGSSRTFRRQPRILSLAPGGMTL